MTLPVVTTVYNQRFPVPRFGWRSILLLLFGTTILFNVHIREVLLGHRQGIGELPTTRALDAATVDLIQSQGEQLLATQKALKDAILMAKAACAELTEVTAAVKKHQDEATLTVSDSSALLPTWVTGFPSDFAAEMVEGSKGLTDKVDGAHLFQYIYQPNLARLIQRKLSTSGDKKIRFLEFGLGCAPGGGMISQTPGGSALGWRHVFDQVGGLEFELHVFEYDAECAKNWHEKNPSIANMVHTGDASSEEDLNRAYEDAGGKPFDVMVDDASHINWHQIKTLDVMLPKVAEGGMFFVEDIVSSCDTWSANMGTHRGAQVGGTSDCMTTEDGKPTILAHLMEYQRFLVGRRAHAYEGYKTNPDFLRGVTKIEFHAISVVLSKEVEKA